MPFPHYSQTGIKKNTPYEHPLDKMLLKIFCQFAAHYIRYYKPMAAGEMGKKFDWSYSEYGSFSKLRHWGLVRMVKNSRTGKLTNSYKLTALGERFYLGEAAVPDYIVTLCGEVLPEGHDAWSYHKGNPPADKTITELDMDWKSHNEWVAERKISSNGKPCLF